MKKFEELKNIVLAAEEDAKKFYEKDNQAAGTRLRKAMQQLKELAHEIRKEVQDIKNSKKGA
ncbi:vacuolar-type H+-ATPase subunit H [Thermonema lapsum]|jgi:vacuolar-type H+-ATPase subunit H|uniref:Vacuolar-type H+-ATPase subunit H n=1 Tax=Thermonema lapsum TaxID=28195 RepID=A0A846MSI6_9BACT|nr:histone H1 [Thermonema lapsum]NIK74312.1 vacuolar-type H+-ATPase subunit H [Thermonema lapsum]